MALTNTWKFLIKEKKYKFWPLLLFYILTIWLASMRVYTSLFQFSNILKSALFAGLVAPILKINIGLV